MTGRPANRSLFVREAMTLAILCLICLITVRPLLEEWGVFRDFNVNGLETLMLNFAHDNAWRPIHLVSYALQWLFGLGGKPFGVGVYAAVMIVARYVCVSWILKPFNWHPRLVWLLATAAAVLPGWNGVWLGRFGAAQFSALCFFIVLGCCIRVSRRSSWLHWLGAALFLVLMLMSYQALALCVACIPFMLRYWRRRHEQAGLTWSDSGRVGSPWIGAGEWRLISALAFGLVIYVAYGMSAHGASSASGYEGNMSQELHRLLTLSGFLVNTRIAATTLWGSNVALMPFWLLLVALTGVCAFRQIDGAGIKEGFVAIRRACVMTLLLPLLTLPYVLQEFLRDPERVLFPTSVGLILVLMTLVMRLHISAPRAAVGHAMPGYPQVGLTDMVCGGLIILALTTALPVYRLVQIERQVMAQIPVPVTKLVVRDYSGKLGNLYSFYQVTLEQALGTRSMPVSATICTPLEVDRLPEKIGPANQVAATKRCEELTTEFDGALILDAKYDGRRMSLSPAPAQ